MSKITPTHDRLIKVPPQLVDAVKDDPEVLAKLSRAQLMMVQDKLARQYLDAADATIAQGAAVAETLRKTANLDPKGAPGSGGSGFSISIVIPGSDKSVTVEGTSKRVTDEGV